MQEPAAQRTPARKSLCQRLRAQPAAAAERGVFAESVGPQGHSKGEMCFDQQGRHLSALFEPLLPLSLLACVLGSEALRSPVALPLPFSREVGQRGQRQSAKVCSLLVGLPPLGVGGLVGLTCSPVRRPQRATTPSRSARAAAQSSRQTSIWVIDISESPISGRKLQREACASFSLTPSDRRCAHVDAKPSPLRTRWSFDV